MDIYEIGAAGFAGSGGGAGVGIETGSGVETTSGVAVRTHLVTAGALAPLPFIART